MGEFSKWNDASTDTNIEMTAVLFLQVLRHVSVEHGRSCYHEQRNFRRTAQELLRTAIQDLKSIAK